MNNGIEKKQVIFTLHDFGKSASINEGIIFSLEHEQNIATQYSLMPNGLASKEAAEYVKERAELSVDLCITFTDFAPIGNGYKTLVDTDGNFLKADTQHWDFSILDKYDEEEVSNEIEAQYQWFLDNVGRKPTALTTQKSEHGDPRILVPLADLAKKEGLPLRTPSWAWFSNYAARSYVDDLGITCSDNVIIATKDWKGENGYSLEEDTEQVIDTIKKSLGVTEILVLTGFVDQELVKMSSVSWQRGEYLNLLVRRPKILEQFRTSFDFISYQELGTKDL